MLKRLIRVNTKRWAARSWPLVMVVIGTFLLVVNISTQVILCSAGGATCTQLSAAQQVRSVEKGRPLIVERARNLERRHLHSPNHTIGVSLSKHPGGRHQNQIFSERKPIKRAVLVKTGPRQDINYRFDTPRNKNADVQAKRHSVLLDTTHKAWTTKPKEQKRKLGHSVGHNKVSRKAKNNSKGHPSQGTSNGLSRLYHTQNTTTPLPSRLTRGNPFVYNTTAEYSLNQCFLQKYCIKVLYGPENICGSKSEIRLFVFIYSMPDNVQRRQLIRKSWANQSYFGKQDFRYIFIVGHRNETGDDSTMVEEGQRADSGIVEEVGKYNDIALVNIVESFYTLTLKGIAGLHYALENCTHARFVMKTDDDMLINMFRLQNKLKDLIQKNDTKHILMGHIWKESFVPRQGRYTITKEQFEQPKWPPFCSGSGYIMSMDVTKLLYKLAMQDSSRTLIHLDDPYMTGVLASRVKLRHRQFRAAYSIYRRHYNKYTKRDVMRYIFLHVHDKDTVDISDKRHLDIWNKMVDFYFRGISIR